MSFAKDSGASLPEQADNPGRRAFLGTLATATAALAVAGCGSSEVSANSPGGGSANLPPAWQTVPTVTFVQGVASSFSVASYVSDPNGNALALSVAAGSLPAGVTFDAAGKRFVYNGSGSLAVANGVMLSANDGQP